jgi:hypothetical protein
MREDWLLKFAAQRQRGAESGPVLCMDDIEFHPGVLDPLEDIQCE